MSADQVARPAQGVEISEAFVWQPGQLEVVYEPPDELSANGQSFPVRHDPATGRFLPADGGGGAGGADLLKSGKASKIPKKSPGHYPDGDGPDSSAPFGRAPDKRPFNMYGNPKAGTKPGDALKKPHSTKQSTTDVVTKTAPVGDGQPTIHPRGKPKVTTRALDDWVAPGAKAAVDQAVTEAAGRVSTLFPEVTNYVVTPPLLVGMEGAHGATSWHEGVGSTIHLGAYWQTTTTLRALNQDLASGRKDGFYAPGTDSLPGVVAHEMGHVVTYAIAERMAATVHSDPPSKLEVQGRTWSVATHVVSVARDADPAFAKLSKYGAADPVEYLAEAVAHVSSGGTDPGARAAVAEMQHLLATGSLAVSVDGLAFPVRHDPATGEYLPEGGAGGSADVPTVPREDRPGPQLQRSLQAHYERWARGYMSRNDDERNAVYRYATADYRDINGALRGGGTHPDAAPIDAALEAAPRTRFPLQLKRTATREWLHEATKPGDEFDDLGYVSTSSSHRFKPAADRIDVDVVVPAGSKGAYLEDVVHSARRVGDDEGEFLLPRGSVFRVVEVGPDKVKVMLVGQPEAAVAAAASMAVPVAETADKYEWDSGQVRWRDGQHVHEPASLDGGLAFPVRHDPATGKYLPTGGGGGGGSGSHPVKAGASKIPKKGPNHFPAGDGPDQRAPFGRAPDKTPLNMYGNPKKGAKPGDPLKGPAKRPPVTHNPPGTNVDTRLPGPVAVGKGKVHFTGKRTEFADQAAYDAFVADAKSAADRVAGLFPKAAPPAGFHIGKMDSWTMAVDEAGASTDDTEIVSLGNFWYSSKPVKERFKPAARAGAPRVFQPGLQGRQAMITKFAKAEKRGWAPPGVGNPVGVLAHEFGHVVNMRLATSSRTAPGLANAAVRAGRKRCAPGDNCVRGFSQYAYNALAQGNDGMEAVADAISHVAAGGRHPFAVGVVEFLGGVIPETAAAVLDGLAFPVRHDPATGKYLPTEGGGGGASSPLKSGKTSKIPKKGDNHYPNGDGPERDAPFGRHHDGRPLNMYGNPKAGTKPGDALKKPKPPRKPGIPPPPRPPTPRRRPPGPRHRPTPPTDAPVKRPHVPAPAQRPRGTGKANVRYSPAVKMITDASALPAVQKAAQLAGDRVGRLFPEMDEFQVTGYHKRRSAHAATSWVPFAPHAQVLLGRQWKSTRQQQDMVGKVKADSDSGFFAPGTDDLTGVLAHEFGHAVTFRATYLTGRSDARGVARRALAAGDAASPGWRRGMGRYANTDPLEGVAEAISHVAAGGKDPGALAVVHHIRGLMKTKSGHALAGLAFPVRHDPSSGRYLPGGGGGGAAGAGASKHPALATPAEAGKHYPDGRGPEADAPFGRTPDGRPLNSLGRPRKGSKPGDSGIPTSPGPRRKLAAARATMGVQAPPPKAKPKPEPKAPSTPKPEPKAPSTPGETPSLDELAADPVLRGYGEKGKAKPGFAAGPKKPWYEYRKTGGYDQTYAEASLVGEDVARRVGYDGPPDVVPRSVIDAAVNAGAVELFRGVSNTGARGYKQGRLWISSGALGDSQGYSSTSRSTAEGYASTAPGHKVLRIALKPDAKVISYDEARRRLQEERTAIYRAHAGTQGVADATRDTKLALIGDEGRWAMLNGYDAITQNPTGEGNYSILNKSATLVQR